MCGRYVASTDLDGLVKLFVIDDRDPAVRAANVRWEGTPNYNVAPTDTVPAVVQHDGARVLTGLRWGLVPFWADDPKIGARMINARAESVAAKPAFKESFEQRRCLVPADGFYEWEKAGGKRLPWYVHRVDGDPMVFAGLWSSWRDPADRDQRLVTCAIITTDANQVIEPVHDRMPVVLEPSAWDDWLDPQADPVDLQGLLVPAADDAVERYRVSTRVNRVVENDPALLDPMPPASDADDPADDASVQPAEQTSLFD